MILIKQLACENVKRIRVCGFVFTKVFNRTAIISLFIDGQLGNYKLNLHIGAEFTRVARAKRYTNCRNLALLHNFLPKTSYGQKTLLHKQPHGLSLSHVLLRIVCMVFKDELNFGDSCLLFVRYFV